MVGQNLWGVSTCGVRVYPCGRESPVDRPVRKRRRFGNRRSERKDRPAVQTLRTGCMGGGSHTTNGRDVLCPPLRRCRSCEFVWGRSSEYVRCVQATWSRPVKILPRRATKAR